LIYIPANQSLCIKRQSDKQVKLVSRKVRSKHSRFALILLLPALIFIGGAGWCLYALGDNHKAIQREPIRSTQKDNVTLLPIILEEQQEIRIHNSTSNN
jgi:hypothetical protein